MLCIHGGAFISGDTTLFDGGLLETEGDVIVVVAAYRLGALWFLIFSGESLRGNYGMMDQIAAMTWVNQNIASLGY